MNTRPPLPRGPVAPDRDPRRITYTLVWPDGDEVVAFLESHWSSEAVQIHWSGAMGKLDAPPHHGDDSLLNAYLERLAERTNGKLTFECSGGSWLVKD